MTKRKNRSYSDEFKKEALALVTEQGYSVSEAATSLGITAKLLYNWKAKFEQEQLAVGLDEVAFELNNRPRKTLGFKTPQQIISRVLR